MNNLATRVGSSVAPLGPNTTFTVLDLDKPVIAATGLITGAIELTCLVLTAVCVDRQKANAEGDYIW